MKNYTLIICFLFTLINLSAQRFSVSVGNLDFELSPGESEVQRLSVRNMSDKTNNFQIQIVDFEVDELNNTNFLPANTIANSCADWIQLSHSLFELGPNETQDVAVILNVPETATTTNWASLLIQPAQEQADLGSVDKSMLIGIKSVGQIAVKVFQNTNKEDAPKATIKNLKHIPTEDKPYLYEVDIINECGRKLENKVYVMLSNLDTAEEKELEEIVLVVLPERSSKLQVELPKDLPKGMYSASLILDYGMPDALEGVQTEFEVK